MIKTIRTILPKDKTYHFAVSMGIDSIAGFVFLLNKGYNLIPIHFNHALREQNLIMMERFLEFCDDIGLKGHIGIGKNLTTEADCRNARLNFYSKVAANGVIITAHHLNDWIESYLLNCFRGHAHHRPFELVSNFGSFSITHPFLLSRKKDLAEYVDRNNLTQYIIEDETNLSAKGSRRNWIRNYIIPQMNNHKLSLEKFAKRQILQLETEINQSE